MSYPNRTVRQAGFFMISELSELKQVLLFTRYGKGDVIEGWSDLLALRDLCFAMLG